MEEKIAKLAERVYTKIYEAESLKSIYSEILNDVVNTFVELYLDKILDNIKIEYSTKNVKESQELLIDNLSKPQFSDTVFIKTMSYILPLSKAMHKEKIRYKYKWEIIESSKKFDCDLGYAEIEKYYKIRTVIDLSETNLKGYEKLFSYYLELIDNKISANYSDSGNPYYRFFKNQFVIDENEKAIDIKEAIARGEFTLITLLIPNARSAGTGLREDNWLEMMFFRFSKFFYIYHERKASQLKDVWDLALRFWVTSDTLENRLKGIYSEKTLNFWRYSTKEFGRLTVVKREIPNKSEEVNEIRSILYNMFNTWRSEQREYDIEAYWSDLERKKLHEEFKDEKEIHLKKDKTITRQAVEITELKEEGKKDKKEFIPEFENIQDLDPKEIHVYINYFKQGKELSIEIKGKNEFRKANGGLELLSFYDGRSKEKINLNKYYLDSLIEKKWDKEIEKCFTMKIKTISPGIKSNIEKDLKEQFRLEKKHSDVLSSGTTESQFQSELKYTIKKHCEETVITSRTREFNKLFKRKFPIGNQRVIIKKHGEFPKPLFHLYLADSNGNFKQLY